MIMTKENVRSRLVKRTIRSTVSRWSTISSTAGLRSSFDLITSTRFGIGQLHAERRGEDVGVDVLPQRRLVLVELLELLVGLVPWRRTSPP